MIALYLDYELDDDERQLVEGAVHSEVECRRIPWLAPPGETEPSPDRFLPHLAHVGLDERLRGRVLLVAPPDVAWYAGLAEAIRHLTGAYPLLIQPEARREAAGCPGPLRVLDMEAYFMEEDATQPPPWERDDESPDAPS